MPPSIDPVAFAALVAATGLPLDAAQIATLREGYALVEPLLERLHAPLPREAEPALIFKPEQA